MRYLQFFTIADFIGGYENIIQCLAKIVTSTLELIGILVIVIGSLRSIFYYIKNICFKKHYNIKISLGNTLALGLEFKMGAEIIKTVIVRNLDELAILGIIILLRAVLAFLIHWEIKVEKKDELETQQTK